MNSFIFHLDSQIHHVSSSVNFSQHMLGKHNILGLISAPPQISDYNSIRFWKTKQHCYSHLLIKLLSFLCILSSLSRHIVCFLVCFVLFLCCVRDWVRALWMTASAVPLNCISSLYIFKIVAAPYMFYLEYIFDFLFNLYMSLLVLSLCIIIQRTILNIL